MRVNVYAEEMTERVEIIAKTIDGQRFTGLRFYLELPVTVAGQQYRGPFKHRPGDDDSSAVTFWGKRDLRLVLRKALLILDEHYGDIETSALDARVQLIEARSTIAGLEAEVAHLQEVVRAAVDVCDDMLATDACPFCGGETKHDPETMCSKLRAALGP